MQGEFRGSFGDFLAMKRKEAGLTIKDVAQWLHISTAYYSYFESGERKAPDRLVLDRLAVILDLTPTELLLLYDLAGQTRGIVAADLPDYINEHPYVRVALRKARDSKASMEQWLNFIKQMDKTPEVSR